MTINRKQLFKVARVVRRCAEEMVKNGDQGHVYVDKKHLGGGCGDVSFVLGQLTGLCHCFESGDYKGSGHCWIRLPNGEIWDLTATQFKVAARIYVVKGDETKNYNTYQRGRPAIAQLNSWCDEKWRARLRTAARAELRREG